MRFDAITFDLDDTLWHNGPVMQITEPGHYTWLGEQIDALAQDTESLEAKIPLHDYQQIRLEIAERLPLQRGDHTFLRRQAMFEVLVKHGLDEASAAEWADAGVDQFMTLRHSLTPFAEVSDLLTKLAANYRLGVITNGNVDVAKLDLAHHFGIRILAGEMFAPKPDPRPFLTAAAVLGAQPYRMIHVGDSWEEDALPAQRLGMHAVWIDAKQEGERDMPERVIRINHIRELQAAIEQLEASTD